MLNLIKVQSQLELSLAQLSPSLFSGTILKDSVWSYIVQYGIFDSVCSHTNWFDLRSYARYGLVIFGVDFLLFSFFETFLVGFP